MTAHVLSFPRTRPARAQDHGRSALLPGRVAKFTRPASDRLGAALAWSAAYVANGCRPPASWK